MNRHPSLVIVALSLCVPLAACAPSPAPSAIEYVADYPTYDTPADLVDSADLVIQGRVLKTRVEEAYPDSNAETDPALNPQAGLDASELEEIDPIVLTVATVMVTEVIKGDVRVGQRVEVSQLGGRLDGVEYVDRGTHLVVPRNAEYVFVLAEHSAAPFDLLNPEQGLYEVAPGGGLTKVDGDNLLPIDEIADLKGAAGTE